MAAGAIDAANKELLRKHCEQDREVVRSMRGANRWMDGCREGGREARQGWMVGGSKVEITR
jgi:hypothetical protein